MVKSLGSVIVLLGSEFWPTSYFLCELFLLFEPHFPHFTCPLYGDLLGIK